MTPATITCYRCECGTIYTEQQMAEACCTCPDCGTATKGHRLCAACRMAAEQRGELTRLRKAERIDPADYDGPVCSDGLDTYYDCIDAWRDVQDGEPETWQPSYLWPCRTETPQLDLDDILEAAQEQYEAPVAGDWDEWCGVEALQAAVDAFNGAQPRDTVWHADLSRVIVLDEAWFDALIAEVR